ITLIPKVPNANMVKDFRPISLIGSLCKVIAKVLANRLVTVLDDIVDEIQSAFVTDRQILDGPFILSEIVHWCLFNGVKLDSSLQISHLFYAVDAIFMGQWSKCNIDTSIRVLDVFYHASGLRINMNKRNLMGISVDSNKVKHAAANIDGGLGVSSLFALNRALMFKWVLRFFSQKKSLWVRVVKALHGEDGKIGKKVQPSFITPKLGNGANTSFWDVAWCGDIAFKNLVPRLYALESMKNIEVASKLSHGGLKFSFRRNPRVGSGDFSVSSVRKLIDNVILSKGISKTRWIKENLCLSWKKSYSSSDKRSCIWWHTRNSTGIYCTYRNTYLTIWLAKTAIWNHLEDANVDWNRKRKRDLECEDSPEARKAYGLRF
nr:RNA-directed DNA polymerase, eukaryota, reverse transcriptase zinc-binding domain protein [Tanacetum cinerariifolium]